MHLRTFILLLLASIAPLVCRGQEVDSLEQARLDSLAITEADDFVTASVLIATPGDVLYTSFGHACIRLQCPHYDFDLVYSYESENYKEKVLPFLKGDLKMGMMAVATDLMMEIYAKDGRGVTEYVLNIPLDKRKLLWQYLDGKLEEGINLRWDYLNRGCAYACLLAIRNAVLPDTLSFGEWDEKFIKKTRRTLASYQVEAFPWNYFILQTISGVELRQPYAIVDKVVTPADLEEVLQKTTLNGQPLVKSSGIMVKQTLSVKPAGLFTPMVLACILLVLAIVSCFWMHLPLSLLLLALQSAFGLLLTYLLLFSKLPITDFNWLIIPFNLLPLLLWHWRRWWLLPFAVICLGWSIVMLIEMENAWVDPAHIVIVLALIVNYIGQWLQIRKQNKLNK